MAKKSEGITNGITDNDETTTDLKNRSNLVTTLPAEILLTLPTCYDATSNDHEGLQHKNHYQILTFSTYLHLFQSRFVNSWKDALTNG